MKLTKRNNNMKNEMKLTKEYIAGFVQADGSFSVTIRRTKYHMHLQPVFTIVQNINNKELILNIQNIFGGIGHWSLIKKDNTIRYQVSNLFDITEKIIPFFIKYQLRGTKYLSFLKFKYIVETLRSREHHKNRDMLISLIVIASSMNPLGKLGEKIRYLNPEEQLMVKNQIQPKNIDISILTNSIINYKPNKLTLDFIHGLFDGDGNITIYFDKSSNSALKRRIISVADHSDISIRVTFCIAQDIHNVSLLKEVKSYFNNVGKIYTLSPLLVRYDVKSLVDIRTIVLPLMINKSVEDTTYDENIKLPIIKGNKIYNIIKILEIINNNKKTYKNPNILIEIIKLSYNVIKNNKNIKMDEYIQIVLNKLNK